MRDLPEATPTTRVSVSFLELEIEKEWELKWSWGWPFFRWVKRAPIFPTIKMIAHLDYAMYFEKSGFMPLVRPQVFELFPKLWGLVYEYETFEDTAEISVVIDWHAFATANGDSEAHYAFIKHMEVAGWKNLSSGLLIG
jgi:hypothetical protein